MALGQLLHKANKLIGIVELHFACAGFLKEQAGAIAIMVKGVAKEKEDIIALLLIAIEAALAESGLECVF